MVVMWYDDGDDADIDISCDGDDDGDGDDDDDYDDDCDDADIDSSSDDDDDDRSSDGNDDGDIDSSRSSCSKVISLQVDSIHLQSTRSTSQVKSIHNLKSIHWPILYKLTHSVQTDPFCTNWPVLYKLTRSVQTDLTNSVSQFFFGKKIMNI